MEVNTKRERQSLVGNSLRLLASKRSSMAQSCCMTGGFHRATEFDSELKRVIVNLIFPSTVLHTLFGRASPALVRARIYTLRRCNTIPAPTRLVILSKCPKTQFGLS